MASEKGRRFVRENRRRLAAEQKKEAAYVRLARITNGVHPDYKNG